MFKKDLRWEVGKKEHVLTNCIAVVSWPFLIKLGTVQQIVTLQRTVQQAEEACCGHHTQRERLSSGQKGIHKCPVIDRQITEREGRPRDRSVMLLQLISWIHSEIPEIKVKEFGGRVGRHRIQVVWGRVWNALFGQQISLTWTSKTIFGVLLEEVEKMQSQQC